ncbi:flowering time control protein FPA [Argentina anserina]|uniref:flowering time control protein FPA n=1 Tax=Argentina anserina TaxID=57926 RepID=UPI0021766DEF|nr:flowering time control protein FPA [Potentilla anserina]XP_050386971.1 flowering time control protein FPA [Potentilla anserina]XP_050386972.1 flowering time control protein FPA [Potentilla anserina]
MAPAAVKPGKQGGGEEGRAMSNNLWVGNIGRDVTDSNLYDLFSQYGALDGVTSYSTRSYAFVLFKLKEEAAAAKEALQGTPVRGLPIKIEFARPAKPSKKLWVGGISPSVSKEELEEEFLKFGKLEDFKFLRDRNTACLEYCRLEDASEAMRNMNGKRLGGDQMQIHVDFLRSQPAALRREQLPDYRDGQFPGRGIMGPAADSHSGHKRKQHYSQLPGQTSSSVLWVGYPPSVQIDEQMLHNAMILFGEIERIKSFPSRHYSFVEFRSVDEARRAKEGLQGRLFNDPRITIMFSTSDLPPAGAYQPGGGKWSAPRPDMHLYNEHAISNLGPGNLPQSPTGNFLGPNDVPMRPLGSLPPGRFDDLHYYQDVSSKKSRLSPPVVRGIVGGPRPPDDDHIWRGIIAKGGTPICRARCVPVGKGIRIEIPEVVNCSARTGLDMLTKHFAEAIAFDIVFFLPDSEDDFASYTEFLHYLGAKNRAGVAKFDDGMTLFLVPPSDFLKNVLKVAGPERLYGVVLKFPEQDPSAASIQQPSHLPIESAQYIDKQQIPPMHAEYSIPSKDEYGFPIEYYNRVSSEEPKLSTKPLYPPTSNSSMVQSVSQDYSSRYSNTGAVSQAGHPLLTPELIGSLANLLPGNAQLPLPKGPKRAWETRSAVRPSFPGWKQDQQISDHSAHALQQLGSQFNPQEQILPQYQPTYPSGSNTSNYHSAPLVLGSTQMSDSSVSLPLPQATNSSRPLSNFMAPSQGGQITGSLLPNHQSYLAEASPVSNYMASSGGNLQSDRTIVPSGPNKVNPEYPNQMQQVHSALIGAGQSTSEGEADKNHRYQSTLQFAANLLLQLQQQQQQQETGSQASRGSGSQQ